MDSADIHCSDDGDTASMSPQVIPRDHDLFDAPIGPTLLRYFQDSGIWGGNTALMPAFLRAMLTTETMVPDALDLYDKNLKFIPGMYFSGKTGPRQTGGALLVVTLPNTHTSTVGMSVVSDLLGDYEDILVSAFSEVGIPEPVWNEFYVTTLVRFPKPVHKAREGVRQSWVREGVHLLLQELTIVQPDVIVAFGTEPSKFFTGYSITKSQSSVFRYVINFAERAAAERAGRPVPEPVECSVVCIPDPKTVLTNTEKRPQFVSGIRLLNKVLSGNEHEEEVRIRYIYTEDEFIALADEFTRDQVTTFSVDCEWGGAHWLDPGAGLRTVQLAWSSRDAAVIVLRHAGMRPAFVPQISTAFYHLGKLLHRPGTRVIGHNIAADFPWLNDQGVDLTECVYFDTMLAAHIFEPTASHGLEDLAVRLIPWWSKHDLAIEDWKKNSKFTNEVLSTRGYGDVPDDLLFPYAGKDACATYALYQVYMEKLSEPKSTRLRELFTELVMPATLAFIGIESRGIKVDPERLQDLENQYHNLYEILLTKFREMITDPVFNVNSPAQKVALLFGKLGLNPIKTTGKYPKPWDEVVAREEQHKFDPACDGETLEILGHKHPVADLLREVCTLGTVVKSFLPRPVEDPVTGTTAHKSGFAGFLKRDGRLHTRIGQMVKTGRLSSSSPNLQNAPGRVEEAIQNIFEKYSPEEKYHKLRTVFTAGPGNLLVVCDYKQAEIAALAHLSGDPTLKDAVAAGTDIHSVVCKQMFNLDCSLKEIKEKYKAKRIAAKAIVFGQYPLDNRADYNKLSSILFTGDALWLTKKRVKGALRCTRRLAERHRSTVLAPVRRHM